MIPAITISSYGLPDFVALNLRACRKLWPDAPIMVSDDLSKASHEISDIAEREGAHFICSARRRGHCAADLQSFLNALAFGQSCHKIALKISQRLIPSSPSFRHAFEAAFTDSECWLAQPGQINPGHVSRPSARFFTRFGRLTDVIAARPERIDRQKLVDHYREAAAVPATRVQMYVEVALGNFIDAHLKDHARIVEAWTNTELGQPKACLRKIQSTLIEYVRLAESLGLPPGDYPLTEWREIEKADYHCLPEAGI